MLKWPFTDSYPESRFAVYYFMLLLIHQLPNLSRNFGNLEVDLLVVWSLHSYVKHLQSTAPSPKKSATF